MIRIGCALLLLTATAGAQQTGTRQAPPPAEPNVVRPLRVLATEATSIALADVTRSETYDEDRLRVHRLRVVRVLRGRLDEPEVGVIEMRAAGGPDLLAAGEHAVFLLAPAPSYSYLQQHLPLGRYLQTVGGRDGVVRIGAEGEVEAVERVIAAGTDIRSLDDAAAAVARRRLAFTELASGNPRLAADALVELRGLETFGALGPEETAALGRVLRDRRIEPLTRAGLIAFLGERRVPGALEALAGAEADTPLVLDALMTARAQLGAPAGRGELAPQLASNDPGVRAAAVRALARLDDPRALDQLRHYATLDQSVDVRIAAIEAVGERKRPDGVPIVARTFSDEDVRLRQASARALIAIGGPEAENALTNLALGGGSPEERRYAAFVLMMSVGRDHPAVRRIQASNPSPEVRELIEHGLPAPGH